VNLAYILPPIFAFSFAIILFVIVIRRMWHSFLHRIFNLFILMIALWALFIFLMRISPNIKQALMWQLAVTIIGPGNGILFYHFTVALTRLRPKSWLLPAGYFLWILFAALTPTGLLVKDCQIKSYGYAPIWGPLMVPYIIYVYFFTVLGLTNLIKAYRISHSSDERNRISYVIAGIGFALVGGLTDMLAVLEILPYPFGILGNMIFCLLAVTAILRYRLLDIRIVFKRGFIYLLISTLVAIPYIGCIFLFYQFFDKPVPAWAYLILLILLALTLHPLWVKMQGLIDRWFYRERYDYLKALEDFSQEAHNISNLDQLSSSLTRLIARALQASSVHLLLPSISGDFSVRAYAGENTSQFGIEGYSSLLRWMQSNRSLLYRQDLDVIPQLQSLTSREIEEFKKIKAELFVPIVTKEKELVGMLILGEKISHSHYSDEDERLLQAVTSRMATELENAHLYDLEKSTRRELEEQNEQKTEFLHSVSHELKTPLTAIISSSELLDDESPVDDSMRKRLIKNIRESAWSMDRRVTELLDLAKVQVDVLKITQAPIEIGPVIGDSVAEISVLFSKKGQKLTVEIPDSLPKVNGDREKLQQVLLNLLSNANKFSPSGSDILLKARKGENKVIIEVKDSAPLVTEEEKKKLFLPYYRGEDASKRERFPGIGLGLAISKQLVGLHHGEIWVETKSGKGNIFAFSLPTLDGKTNNAV
jgi:signal transduction histidine kinase